MIKLAFSTSDSRRVTTRTYKTVDGARAAIEKHIGYMPNEPAAYYVCNYGVAKVAVREGLSLLFPVEPIVDAVNDAVNDAVDDVVDSIQSLFTMSAADYEQAMKSTSEPALTSVEQAQIMLSVAGVTPQAVTENPELTQQITDPRKVKARLADAGWTKTRYKNRKGVLAPMYVVWRMDGDMYRMCSILAAVGLSGGWMTYAQLVAAFGANEVNDAGRRAGKGALKSLDRYLRECELGSKLRPFGWRLETEGRDPKSKTWEGSTLRITPCIDCESVWVRVVNDSAEYIQMAHTIADEDRDDYVEVPLVLRPLDQAELHCALVFNQTRTGFGADCAEDFAKDHDMPVADYLSEQGNPASDEGWFIDSMSAHGFKAVDR